MSFDFEITIKRTTDKSALGTKLAFNMTDDLEEIFTPKVVAMLLKSYAESLENQK